MKLFYCDTYQVPLPSHHRFPMDKYQKLRESILASGAFSSEELILSNTAKIEDILMVHDTRYVNAFLEGTLTREEIIRIGFPWSLEYVQRSLASVQGTISATKASLTDGVAGNLAGGTHHAFRDYGSGYCTFNDIAIAATKLLNQNQVQRILIFDVDVHQGDGTAAIFQGESRVFTCSLHGAKNFPRVKQVSNLDVALPDNIEDQEYLKLLEQALVESLKEAKPEFFFYQAGVDSLKHDQLGRLSLSVEGLRKRDELVFQRVKELNIPLVITIGGGYAKPISETIQAHLNTYLKAKEVFFPRKF